MEYGDGTRSHSSRTTGVLEASGLRPSSTQKLRSAYGAPTNANGDEVVTLRQSSNEDVEAHPEGPLSRKDL